MPLPPPAYICLVGTHQANEMLLLGKKFYAREALKAHLLNEVFTEKGDQFTEKVALPTVTHHPPPQGIDSRK
jgi:enoyl-CoA hydratase/carnithine racemase